MINVWRKLPSAVGALDGTSFEIYRPKTEPQELYYSGFKHFHAIHALIIVDNLGKTRYIQFGFSGYQNDAKKNTLLPNIAEKEPPFHEEYVLLATEIYPYRNQMVRLSTAQQINRETFKVRRKYNRMISLHRSIVERSFAKLKTYIKL